MVYRKQTFTKSVGLSEELGISWKELWPLRLNIKERQWLIRVFSKSA